MADSNEKVETKKAQTADRQTVTVGGREYKLQRPGVKWYFKHTDKSRNRMGVLQSEDYIQGLLENVVVEPKGLTFDDFDSVKDLEDLVEAIESFLRGKVLN